jgi:GNAT superfamily N-acetyltransferase
VSGFRVRPYRDEDEGPVRSLLDRTLGPGPAGMRPSTFFRWKHLENPSGRSVLLVAEAAGEVIGLRAFMRWTFHAGDRSVPAVRAVDTATDPAHQGRGVFSALTAAALDAAAGSAAFVFNTPNAASGPGYRKLGWREVDRIRPLIRLRRPLRAAVRTGLRRPPTPLTVRGAPRFSELAEAVAEAAGLSAEGEGRLATPRTPEYLGWRYGRVPGLEYRALVDQGGRGAAVFRVRARGALREAAVTELLTAPGDLRTARGLLAAIRRAADVDHLVLLPPGPTVRRAARRDGFLPAPFARPLVVRPLGHLPVDPTRPEAWALSLGDLEVF